MKTKVLVSKKNRSKKKVLVKKGKKIGRAGTAPIDVMNLVPGARDMTNV